MFIHNLHEETKNYLKTLLVEDDAAPTKKGGKKSKTKKEEKPVKTDSSTTTPPPPPTPPVSDSTVVVEPTKTSLTPEETAEKEKAQRAAEEKERRARNLPLDRTNDPKMKEFDKEYLGGPIDTGFGYDTGDSGRGRGAPPVSGEPEDRTGIRQNLKKYGEQYKYNYTALLGKSLQNIPDTTSDATKGIYDPLKTAVIEPYQDLQRIKVLRSMSPAILQKLGAIGKVETADMSQAALGPRPYNPPKNWDGNIPQGSSKRADVLVDIGVIPSGQTGSYTQDQIDAAYEAAKKKIEKQQGSPKDFMGLVQRHAESLSGLGGLDPFFGEELAAKLLGGEWVEKAMQNIAPAQERGVISSMGNRSSIGM